MGAVLIDNWNLSEAKLVEKYKNNIPNESYSNLLSAMVLWDDVYYLDDGFATFGWISTSKGQSFKSLLKPLYLDSDVKTKFEEGSNIIFKRDFSQDNKKIVAQRAIFYHEISKAFGMDYYPIKERAEFLDGFINSEELWSRNEILKKEEKEILKRIQEFNLGSESFMKIPLLSNLIIKNSEGDYLKTALDIKNAREVKKFRKYMDKIDKEINMGNYNEVRYILKLIPYIIDEIENMDKKLHMTATVKIKLTPMVLSMVIGTILSNFYSEDILVRYGLICNTLQQMLGESDIEINKKWTYTKYPKIIQVNFLRTLAKEYLNI